MARKKDLERLIDGFERQKEQLLSVGIFRKGTITKRWMTCGNPKCSCKTDREKRHGPYYWWTTKEKGRTRAILVPKKFLPEAKMYLKNNRELKRKLRVLSELSERIIREKLKSARKA